MKINCVIIAHTALVLISTPAIAPAFADRPPARPIRVTAEEKCVTGSGNTQAAAYQDAHSRLPAGKDATRETTKEINRTWYCTLFYNG